MHQSLEELIDSMSRCGGDGNVLDGVLREICAALRRELARPGPATGDAFARVHDALATLPAAARGEDVVESLLGIAQYFFACGRSDVALRAAALAAESASRLSQPTLRRALTVFGGLRSETGNVPGALEVLSTALDLALELGDLTGECAVWNNLGAAYLSAAQHRDALACFERTLVRSRGIEGPAAPRLRNLALSNIAVCCLQLEDYGRGLRAAADAAASLAEPGSAQEAMLRVVTEANYARLLLAIGSRSVAGQRCEIARRYAADARSERAELMAAMAEGLYEVHVGRLDVGLSRLARVLERARSMRLMVRDALITNIKAMELAGKPDVALVFLRELMMQTKQVQQEIALTHHLAHLREVEARYAPSRDPVNPGRADAVLREQEQALRTKLVEKVAEEELLRARMEMLERLAVTAELRDDATGEHAYRVARLASLLAREAGEDEKTCTMIDLAGRLHDIGKIGVPDGLLLKNARLNEAEMRVMQTHTTVGAELLAQSQVPHLNLAEEIARFHHEWWDGNGYPFGIGATAIPRAARMVALADVFDALTHPRPYKEAWSIDRALDEISRRRGTQFDPELVDLFVALIRRLVGDGIDLDEMLGEAARQSPLLRAREKIAATLRRYAAEGQEGKAANDQVAPTAAAGPAPVGGRS